jgi:hypothetical protein
MTTRGKKATCQIAQTKQGWSKKKNLERHTHNVFIVQHMEYDPTITVVDTTSRLYQSFEGLAITKLAVYEYITKECCFSLKRIKKNRQAK